MDGMDIEKLKARSEIIRLIRRWFDERGFLEMHTPRLVGLPGQEPHLEPFWTTVVEQSAQCPVPSAQHNGLGTRHSALGTPAALSTPAALITSPEYMLKRLLAAGLDKIYDLGPCFRNNEPWDGSHDPEFLLLEWYRRDAGLEDLMRDTEEMMRFVGAQFIAPNQRMGSSSHLGVMNHAPTLETTFRRLTVESAWREYAGIELAPLLGDRKAMASVCREHNQTANDDETWDDLYYKIFLSLVEPKICGDGCRVPSARCPVPGAQCRVPSAKRYELGTRHSALGTFLYRYPASQAALARLSKDDPRWADRVEVYAGGLELANGYAELADPVEQRKRFEEDRALRRSLEKETWDIDEALLDALPKMGDAAGIAFGVDRFVMLLTGAKSINDVVPSSARERFHAS